MNRAKVKDYILLHIILLLYSFSGICSKLASAKPFLSLGFIVFYSLTLLILFGYAILWQQVLKNLSLTTAFANKAIVIVWGIIWGSIIFDEKITIYMIVGAILIFMGIILVVSNDE